MTPARLSAAAAPALLVLWMGAHLAQLWGTWPYDLAAVYIAGHFWEQGQLALVYAAPEHFFGGPAPEWMSTIALLGGGEQGAFPFIYPPLWAALMAPLTKVLSAQTFFNMAYLVQLPLVAACISLARRISGSDMPAWKWTVLAVVLLESSVPFAAAINQNQPSILIGFLILLAAERSLAGAPRPAGFALALATAIKITPALFVLVLVQRRDWRAVGWFAIFASVFLLADLALSGVEANQAFLAALRAAGGASLISPVNVSAKALADFGLALVSGTRIYATENMYILELPRWLQRLSVGVTLILWLGLGGRAILAAQALPERPRMLITLLALSVGLFLFGPLGWQHYYLLPLLLLPGLLAAAPLRQACLAALPALAGTNITLFTLALDLGMRPGWYVGLAAGSWALTLWLIGSLTRPATLHA